MTEAPFFKPRVSWGAVLATAVLAVAASSATTMAIIYKFLSSQPLQPAPSAMIPEHNPTMDAVAASGRLEPQGEVIYLSAPYSREGARVEQLLVKVGDRLRAGQIIAVLDNRDRLQAALGIAQTQVRVA
ncbi:MAG: HlyD family secretion protein, partial [Microcystaceae cyanobacterium]